MERLQHGFLLMFLLSNMGASLADGGQQNPTADNATSSATTYPLRTDLLTVEECNLYWQYGMEKSMCMMVFSSIFCVVDDEHPRQDLMLNTYLDVSCVWKRHALVAKTTKRVREISPQRAVLLNLFQYLESEDPLTTDVVDPVRNQMIHLGVFDCQAPNATAQVYELGNFPNLYDFEMNSCTNLTIRKKDFSRMPQLRMVTFYITSISALEPGTFTDMPHLGSLILERDFITALWNIGNPESAYSKFATDEYLDYLYNLHCGCSFAWLRNFLEQKPFLIEEKNEGEVFIIGNYLSQAVQFHRNHTDILSVDCSKDITVENVYTGHKFSYNASYCDSQFA
ncbi:uncharacterized protein LOC129595709 [Paramacrobiotus metropolitanus]|uniref:uncharacterized protein LOC129595709 n=1 Tax=Paramacrobiotus metropolitanus TaxID=2943436 RepID=UPI00244584EE|nr:uncharacterized protein LOC129595709 [Paramacrobiotus metropolitanus]